MSDYHCDGCGHVNCICDQELNAIAKERSDQAMKGSAEALKRLRAVLDKRPTCPQCHRELVFVSKYIHECLKCGTCFIRRPPLVNVDWAVQTSPPEHIDLRFTV